MMQSIYKSLREHKIRKRVIVLSLALLTSVVVEPLASFGVTASAASPKATQVATGHDAACAIASGKVRCWGDNSSGQLGNNSTKNSIVPVEVGGLLSGKSVQKVSVGKDHACAIAEARAYCWGNNSHGELGNRDNGISKRAATPVAVSNTGNSALSLKEITDVAAGDDFSCALASDGVIACWGRGDNGRLGNNDTEDWNFPIAVHGQQTQTVTKTAPKKPETTKEKKKAREDREKERAERGEQRALKPYGLSPPVTGLKDKKGIKLAKASEATMCAIVATGQSVTSGSAYCWGKGVDDGTALSGVNTEVTKCDKDAPGARPTGSSKTTILESEKPTLIPGAEITSIDGQDYVTGLGTDSKAYYWGMFGYKETVSYSNAKSCLINTCTASVAPIQQVTLAGTSLGNANKHGNQHGNNRGGVSSVSGTGRKATVRYNDGSSQTFTDRRNDPDSCGTIAVWGFTKTTTYTLMGKRDVTQPPSWPQAQSGFSAVSGNAYDGLFCSVSATAVQCDGHGTSTKAGQLGNGQNKQITGVQTVVGTGFLAGKYVNQLSTGSTGYTCAVASGEVGCWGENSKGQLGTGDKKDKNVPTRVGL